MQLTEEVERDGIDLELQFEEAIEVKKRQLIAVAAVETLDGS